MNYDFTVNFQYKYLNYDEELYLLENEDLIKKLDLKEKIKFDINLFPRIMRPIIDNDKSVLKVALWINNNISIELNKTVEEKRICNYKTFYIKNKIASCMIDDLDESINSYWKEWLRRVTFNRIHCINEFYYQKVLELPF